MDGYAGIIISSAVTVGAIALHGVGFGIYIGKISERVKANKEQIERQNGVDDKLYSRINHVVQQLEEKIEKIPTRG